MREYSRSIGLPSTRSATSAGRDWGVTQVDLSRSCSRPIASRLRLNASQRTSSSTPSLRPATGRLESALASRNFSRYSALVGDIRYGHDLPVVMVAVGE